MSKIDDSQLDKTVFTQSSHFEIHTPTGRIPATAADAPIVSGKIVAFSAGKQITPTGTIVTPYQKIANPA